MDESAKAAVLEYQCPGCICGDNISCFVPSLEVDNVACERHSAGTVFMGVGSIFLGMPKGFNRVGPWKDMPIFIYQKFDDSKRYDFLNIATWKYLDKNGNTIVRGLCPRVNQAFLHIFLEDCIEKIHCYEIKQDDLDKID